MTIAKLASDRAFIHQRFNGWCGTAQDMREKAASIVDLCADREITPRDHALWVAHYKLIADLAENLEQLWSPT